jgi:DNA-binding transcriptional MerR regulator
MGGWTLAELAKRAARVLAEGGVRAPSGRVTEVPDPRLIRWYTTIGLLDRPTIGPGRVARYGPRHLLQLVAVKRLQAQGLPLAQIQQRLAGATDDQLRAVAALPAGFPDDEGTTASAQTGDGPPTRPTTMPAGRRQSTEASRGGRAERFWAVRPAAGESPEVAEGPARVDSDRDTVPRVYGVRLGGLTLLLPAEPASHDLADIAAAARPLLDLLADRGLLDPDGGSRR